MFLLNPHSPDGSAKRHLSPHYPDENAKMLLTKDIEVVEGREYRIRFVNMSMMEHPMHLHGHGFELLAVDGTTTSGIVKDTVTVRPMGGVVEVLLRADNPFRGRFLLHCHNEQHMNGGMATVVRYV